MEFKVNRNSILNILGKIQNIIEKRNTMPVLVNVLLELNEDHLKVFATDLEVSFTDEVPVDVIDQGVLGVNAKNLFDIVKELSDSEIHFKSNEANWLEIQQGKYQSKLVGIAKDEYPVFPTIQSEQFTVIQAQLLKDMIDKTIYSVSNDETRYHLNGVYFESLESKEGNASFKMVATDGHRLSIIDRSSTLKDTSTFGKGVIIPKKGLHEIKKLLESVESNLEMSIEGAQMVVKNGTTILMIRLIEGKYPNYKQLIPSNMPNLVKINRDQFLVSLKRVSLLANQKSKGVTLALNEGKMTISSNNPELGDAKEEIDVDYDGSDIKIGFNAKYITDVLSAITDEEVELELNDQLSPGIMRPNSDKHYTCIVMPMRI